MRLRRTRYHYDSQHERTTKQLRQQFSPVARVQQGGWCEGSLAGGQACRSAPQRRTTFLYVKGDPSHRTRRLRRRHPKVARASGKPLPAPQGGTLHPKRLCAACAHKMPRKGTRRLQGQSKCPCPRRRRGTPHQRVCAAPHTSPSLTYPFVHPIINRCFAVANARGQRLCMLAIRRRASDSLCILAGWAAVRRVSAKAGSGADEIRRDRYDHPTA